MTRPTRVFSISNRKLLHRIDRSTNVVMIVRPVRSLFAREGRRREPGRSESAEKSRKFNAALQGFPDEE